QVASAVVPGYTPGPSGNIKLRDLCLADLAKAEEKIGLINGAYYAKIASGVVALVAAVGLTASVYRLGPLTKIVSVFEKFVGRRKLLFLFALLVLLGAILPSTLGWYVREVGRKPWTVYGLLYPEELVTPAPVPASVMILFTAAFTVMAVGGIYGMYLVATRPLEFVKLLRRGAGVEE
ncbi:MAG: cytochrome ubiquinol oxidase subunit I, partial [Candidatus Caldarchaeum sp.]|nr:cytochrome ubiquinol oxidase subunit I [Candidatus Caldarchaeum sp.]MDW8436009.1 cytochrome ubiquinol oxidase subunit I [Candidatus Caldarchaeum sp.]